MRQSIFRSAFQLPRRFARFPVSRIAGGFSGVAVASAVISSVVFADQVDYADVRKAVADILDKNDYDDGSLGPVLVRLAWHAAGTYDKVSKTGGTDGATMRYPPESTDGANAGLDVARRFLEPVKAKFPGISYADLWVLAANVAIEEMGGPKLRFTPGRKDATDGSRAPPNGRLPDASQGAQHVRDVFYRMGFNDREIVALVGAHCLGRCHTDRSGFDGPWTFSPTTFSNLYFQELLTKTWTVRKWSGPKQYADPSGALMMLPADLALRDDPEFRKYTELYANDQQAFFNDFAAAWPKLMELGFEPPKRSVTPLFLISLLAFAGLGGR